MKPKHQPDEVTLERLERARAAVAYAMTLDGAVYSPIFERLESEIAARHAADDIMARAKRCLDDYAATATPAVGVKAIS